MFDYLRYVFILQLDIDMFPRSWHIAAPLYSANSAACQVAIFGGNVHSEGYTGKRRNAADIRILSFGQCDVHSMCRMCNDFRYMTKVLQVFIVIITNGL